MLESTATNPWSLFLFIFEKEESVSSQVIISMPSSSTPESIVASFSSLGTIITGNSSFCKIRQVRRSRFFAL